MEKRPYVRIEWTNCHLDYDYTVCEFDDVKYQLEAIESSFKPVCEEDFNEWKSNDDLPEVKLTLVMLTDEDFEKEIERYDK